MCVSIPFRQIRVSRRPPAAGQTELTRGHRDDRFPRTTLSLPGLTAGKNACHSPAAAPAGFFLKVLWLTYGSPAIRLHPYRRSAPGECFVVRMSFFDFIVTHVSIDGVRSWNVMTFFAQIFIEIRTSRDNLSLHPVASGHLNNRMQSRRASARMFLYTQLLFLDILDATSRS